MSEIADLLKTGGQQRDGMCETTVYVVGRPALAREYRPLGMILPDGCTSIAAWPIWADTTEQSRRMLLLSLVARDITTPRSPHLARDMMKVNMGATSQPQLF